MELTAAEEALATAIGFDHLVCALIKQRTAQVLERLLATTEDGDQEETSGLSLAVARADVESMIATLQPELMPRGYRAFWSERRGSGGRKDTDEIVIVKTSDVYEIIRLRRPDGANYGVFTDDIVAKLKDWEGLCELVVYGAASDWVALEFRTLPENICRFAEDVYSFCPDSVEQGSGLMNESEDPEAFRAARELCPELSPEMQEKLAAQHAQFAAMDIPAELRQLFASGAGLSTPTDMGIRLLAHEIKRSKQLFLWWD